MQRNVYCYAECRNGEWEAICLDLDIAVQGDSLPRVLDDLRVAILEHLNYVMTLPEGEREALLYRSVPLRVKVGFALKALRTIVLRGGGNDRGQGTFTLPCAA